MALLPPKLAHELKNNRCVNIHGGTGGNVPGDLALELGGIDHLQQNS
jgi:hypothetical protein